MLKRVFLNTFSIISFIPRLLAHAGMRPNQGSWDDRRYDSICGRRLYFDLAWEKYAVEVSMITEVATMSILIGLSI